MVYGMNARGVHRMRGTRQIRCFVSNLSNARRCTSSGTAEATADKPRFLVSVLAWYSKKLDTHPLLTKATTSGLIGGSGDLICQSLVDKPEKERLRQTLVTSGALPLWWWDGWRTARFCFLGTVFVAPWCHYWYGALASRYPLGAATAAAAATSNAMMVVKRVALDQFVFSPIFLLSWLTSLWTLENGIMSSGPAVDSAEKDNLPQIPARLIATMPGILVANWILWIPVQAINFRFTPTKFQVLTSNCVALFWNAYLSFSTRTKPTECPLGSESRISLES
jgi:hypothetical protein